ncbi:ASCH domain-containing protein [Promethearchaeum syntrophicum]|uniref:ASCH domain-containing protein n=1 Tax=Promethearchaeum syntrophicum TaxID=2594042 RepID=A0A5B9D780_9ARCH|nr:ASCH domain-containing protein [Candidatus Prometheoarchaeum syntrophicum]QEE14700.1 ASCH domain protein [Candidatus Prometheoarchaeum syntrophicum]
MNPVPTFYFILDKNHNFLVESVEGRKDQEKYFPKISAKFKKKLQESFPEQFLLNQNFHLKILNNTVIFEVILLKQEIKPEFPNLRWVSISKITDNVNVVINSTEKISIAPGKIQEIYYSEVLQGYSLKGKDFEVWHFCNNESDANNLAELVRKGIKCATASLYDVYQAENEPIPSIGSHSVIINYDGLPQSIIRTTKVDIVPFEEVSADFARIEGEGDKSLNYWRRVHNEFFSEESKVYNVAFTPRSLVICEQFEVVKIIIENKEKTHI